MTKVCQKTIVFKTKRKSRVDIPCFVSYVVAVIVSPYAAPITISALIKVHSNLFPINNGPNSIPPHIPIKQIKPITITARKKELTIRSTFARSTLWRLVLWIQYRFLTVCEEFIILLHPLSRAHTQRSLR